MCRWNWFHYGLRVCTELQFLSKTASNLWFYAYKKYKNGNSARYTSTQHHNAHMLRRKWQFQFWNIWKITKNSHFKRHFLETADRITAKFCMTIKKIKPNDIFQNCIHSTSTLPSFSLWQTIFYEFPQYTYLTKLHIISNGEMHTREFS